ncbi:MAG TPA: cytochrome c [Anaeromyxobacteraceae bacterium]|jgi:mono/diheme cytochrome c family protein
MRALLLCLAALAAGCDVLDPMMVQQKVKLYRPSDFWEDGVAMRPAPPGTVAREELHPPEVESGLGPDGKALQRSPLPVTRALLDLGRKRFEVVCAVCHGLVGDGESAVAVNMSLRPPPSLHLKAQNPDGYFFQVVSLGFGVMPSYASHLTVEERWAVVAYLRALQLSQRARIEHVPPEERARLREGGTR